MAALNLDARQDKIRRNHHHGLGSGKVSRSCKYYDPQVFATDYYDPKRDSNGSDISVVGNLENCKEPEWPPRNVWDIHYLSDVNKISRLDTLRCLIEAEKRLVPIDEFDLKQQNLMDLDEQGALRQIELDLKNLKATCEQGLSYAKSIRDSTQQLDQRWAKTGQANEPSNFQYVCKSLVFVNTVQEQLQKLQEQVEEQEKSIETLSGKRTYILSKSASRLPVRTPSKKATTPLTQNKLFSAPSRFIPKTKSSANMCPQYMARLQQTYKNPPRPTPTLLGHQRPVTPATAARNPRPAPNTLGTTPGVFGAAPVALKFTPRRTTEKSAIPVAQRNVPLQAQKQADKNRKCQAAVGGIASYALETLNMLQKKFK